MNDRAFRLDFFVAIGALLVSALTAATLIYQTRVIGHQFAATTWPYLSISTTLDPQFISIEVANDGLGPALIRSAQLSVDGRPLSSWNDYFGTMAKEELAVRQLFARAAALGNAGRPTPLTISAGSIGPSSTLRPGESHQLVKVAFSGQMPASVMQAFLRHRIALDFCYCSLEGTCWTLHGVPEENQPSEPQEVPSCADAHEIQSNPIVPPPATAAPR